MAAPVVLGGDCLEVLKTLADNSIDAVVTDPPYHLTSIVKRFGSENAAPVRVRSNMETGADHQPPNRGAEFQRLSRGFMGKQWDGGDIAFRVELWSEVLRVLKPGGHVASFGGTRTFHRMVCAIEDAGFEVRDCIFYCYGTGFPKSRSMRDIGRSELGTALKPAVEPICLARKPLSEPTIAANVLRWGTGAINVDACRVEGIKPQVTQGVNSNATSFNVAKERRISGPPTEGRWPANLCHDGSQEVLDLFPETGPSKASAGRNGKDDGDMFAFHRSADDVRGHDDMGGSAARYFYCAKASKADRAGSKHPTVKPVKLMQWLCRLITPPGGTILDPFAGSGTTGMAARLDGFQPILIEREAEYITDIRRRMGDSADLMAAAE